MWALVVEAGPELPEAALQPAQPSENVTITVVDDLLLDRGPVSLSQT
jgi:hypothetical protein